MIILYTCNLRDSELISNVSSHVTLIVQSVLYFGPGQWTSEMPHVADFVCVIPVPSARFIIGLIFERLLNIIYNIYDDTQCESTPICYDIQTKQISQHKNISLRQMKC